MPNLSLPAGDDPCEEISGDGAANRGIVFLVLLETPESKSRSKDSCNLGIN